MTQSQASPGISPISQNGFLRRNARLIASVSLFVTCWMMVYAFFVHQPNFAAKSVVIVKDSAITNRYVEPDHYYAMQTTTSSSSNPVLNTMGILKSHAISQALWTYFSTRRPAQLSRLKIVTLADWERFYQDGSAFIKAKNQPGTDLISVQFGWSDPYIAREALSVVLKAFQDTSRDLNREEQIHRTQYMSKQVGELEKQLNQVRQQKSTYQSSELTVSVRREGDDLAGSRMELANKLSQLEAQARGKENISRRYQKLVGMNPEEALSASALGQNASLSRLQDELYRLQQQYSLLNTSLTEANPKIKELLSQIAQVKANIAMEKSRTMGNHFKEGGVVADGTRNGLIANMLQAQGEAQDLRAQANVIQQRLDQVNEDIRHFPTMVEGLASIEQKEVSLSAALDQLRQKLMEGKLKEAQTLSNVFIVEAPRLPEKAQFPTKGHLMVLGLMAGLALGIAVAIGKEQMTTGQVQGLPEWSHWMEPIDKAPEPDPETPPPSPGKRQEQLDDSSLKTGIRRQNRQPDRKIISLVPRMVTARRSVGQNAVPYTPGPKSDRLKNLPPVRQSEISVEPTVLLPSLQAHFVLGPVTERANSRVTKASQDNLTPDSNLTASTAELLSPEMESLEQQFNAGGEHPASNASALSQTNHQPALKTQIVRQSPHYSKAKIYASRSTSQSMPLRGLIWEDPDNIPVLHTFNQVFSMVSEHPTDSAVNETTKTSRLENRRPRRKFRSVKSWQMPAFLLDGRSIDPEFLDSDKMIPVILPSQTSGLLHGETGGKEPANAQTNQKSFKSTYRLDDDRQAQPEISQSRSHIPAFMLEDKQVLKTFRKAEEGVGFLAKWFTKRPDRHPKISLGLFSRKQKQVEPSYSLNRLFQSQENLYTSKGILP